MIQATFNYIDSIDASNQGCSLFDSDLNPKPSNSLCIRILCEVAPLGLWAKKQLESAGHSVKLECVPVVRYAARHLKSVNSELLEGVFKQIRPFCIGDLKSEDSFEDDTQIELHLGGESIQELGITIESDSEVKLQSIADAVHDCGVSVSKLEHRFIPSNSVAIYGDLGPFQRSLILWLADQHAPGYQTDFSRGRGFGSRVTLRVRDPELVKRPVEKRFPVVLEGDDSVSLEKMRSWLQGRGFEVLESCAKFENLTEESRLEVVNGPFRTLEGRALVNEVLAYVKQLATEASVDTTRYPVILRTADNDSAFLRIQLPINACRQNRVAPWSGPYPERFSVIIKTDKPEDRVVQRLMRRLNHCGFTEVSIEPFPALRERDPSSLLTMPAPGTMLIGDLANYPKILDKIEREVNKSLELLHQPSLFTCETKKEFADDDFDCQIILPIGGMRNGEMLRRLESPRIYDFSVFTTSERQWEPLLLELKRMGYRVEMHHEPAPVPLLRYGGARPSVVQKIQDLVFKMSGLEVVGTKCWGDGDNDLFLSLPELDEPLKFDNGEVAADPEAERLALEEEQACYEEMASEYVSAYYNARPNLQREFLQIEGEHLWVGLTRLERRSGAPSPLVPQVDEGYCIDSSTAETLKHIARSVELEEPCLLEGETASSKTSSIMQLAARLNQPLKRINLNGQTDTGDLIGRFIPDEQKGNGEPESAAASRGSGRLGWRWQEGDLLQAMRHGWWIVLDEINLAEPQILERLNSLLEFQPSLIVSEHEGEAFGPGGIPIHPDFRIFATMNPADYAGRSVLSPAYKDRWRGHLQTVSPNEASFLKMLKQLVYGVRPVVDIDDVVCTPAPCTPAFPLLGQHSEISGLLEALARFHSSVESAAGQRPGSTATLCNDLKEKPVYTRRALLSVLKYLEAEVRRGSTDFPKILYEAVDRYYRSRVPDGKQRDTIFSLMVGCGITPGWMPPKDALAS